MRKIFILITPGWIKSNLTEVSGATLAWNKNSTMVVQIPGNLPQPSKALKLLALNKLACVRKCFRAIEINNLPVLLRQTQAWFQYKIALFQNSSFLSTSQGPCSVWVLTPGLEAKKFNGTVKGHSTPAGLRVRKTPQTRLIPLRTCS